MLRVLHHRGDRDCGQTGLDGPGSRRCGDYKVIVMGRPSTTTERASEMSAPEGARRFFTPRPPRTPALNSNAPIVVTRRWISSMPHSTPTWSTKRSPMRAGWVASCAGWVWNVALSASRGQNGLGQPHRLRAQGGQPDRDGCHQPRRRHAAAPLPTYGEKPRPQCVRQAGHQHPRPIDAAHARV